MRIIARRRTDQCKYPRRATCTSCPEWVNCNPSHLSILPYQSVVVLLPKIGKER